MRAALTNVDVGKAIGLSHAGVSRIRGGARLPSLNVMLKIERRFHWPIKEQIACREDGTYAEQFERVLDRAADVVRP